MPNWCDNVATFEHDDPAQINRVAEAYNSGNMMEKFFPCPPALHDTTSGYLGHGTPEQAALEEQQKTNLAIYGYKDWYDWAIGEWGTKWDVGLDEYHDPVAPELPNTITLGFQSAWSPPCEFYDKMRDLGFRIKAHFFEPGVGFCGTYDDSKTAEYSIEVNNKRDLKKLEKKIPGELLDAFSIIENLSDYFEQEEA